MSNQEQKQNKSGQIPENAAQIDDNEHGPAESSINTEPKDIDISVKEKERQNQKSSGDHLLESQRDPRLKQSSEPKTKLIPEAKLQSVPPPDLMEKSSTSPPDLMEKSSTPPPDLMEKSLPDLMEKSAAVAPPDLGDNSLAHLPDLGDEGAASLDLSDESAAVAPPDLSDESAAPPDLGDESLAHPPDLGDESPVAPPDLGDESSAHLPDLGDESSVSPPDLGDRLLERKLRPRRGKLIVEDDEPVPPNLKNNSKIPKQMPSPCLSRQWSPGAVVVSLIAIAFLVYALQFRRTPILETRSPLQIFQDEFEDLQKDFPQQSRDLWLRSGKMLKNHLNKSHPEEPATIILTAAQDAKHTLLCLASGLAKAYAVARNSSWLVIHGPAEAKYDDSTAKLLIDEKLCSGFKTVDRAAVVSRLETLPPGSLLILYKYCDHENAAYKNVALVLTVLLEDSSLQPDNSLPELEEKVRDFLWQQFIRAGSVKSHQEMDSDKLSGVWSRISHLVLPVFPVQSIEVGKCLFAHEGG